MSETGIPNLASKLQHLFRTIPQPEGQGFYSNEAVVTAVIAQGVPLTVQHLSNLRNGRRDNPSARLLDAIAKVFGVPTGYFFSDEEERQVNKELEALDQLRRTGGLRLRGDIDAAGLKQVLAALALVREAESRRDQTP